jgi:hypothetical protein
MENRAPVGKHVEYWGCLSKTNAERFEAAHHAMTKKVYEGTTKKKTVQFLK